MASFSISIDIDELPEPEIDDEVIAGWVEARLNDAANTFRNRLGAGGIGRPGGQPGRRWPISRTGALADSIAIEMTGPHSGRIYSTVHYAEHLANAGFLMLADARNEVLGNRPQREILASAAGFKK